MPDTQHFIFALVEDFTHMAFASAVDPLRIANMISGQEHYRWSYASDDGAWAQSSDGTEIRTHYSFAQMPAATRVFVLSGLNMQHKDHSGLIAALRRLERHSQTRLGALCSGAYVLAKAGILDGRSAAIHWEYHDSFTEEFPEVRLLRNVFVADDKILSASGGTAPADLMLHLIEQDHGAELAQAVADQMVYSAARAASAEQKVSLQSRQGMRNAHLVKAIDIMKENIDSPVSPNDIAAQIGISTRQLERCFGKYLNSSPKRYYMEMRLERAQNLLVQTEMSIIEVAMACGFESPGHFSRVYRTAFGVTPMMQRGKLK